MASQGSKHMHETRHAGDELSETRPLGTSHARPSSRHRRPCLALFPPSPLAPLPLALVLISALVLAFSAFPAGAKAVKGTAKARGPCSARSSAKVVTATRVADLQKRLRYSRSQTVIVRVASNMDLTAGLILGPGFSCTIFTPARGKKSVTLYHKGWTAPVLTVNNASNILFTGINIRSEASPLMPGSCNLTGISYGDGAPCPSLFFWAVHHVQFTKASVTGRVLVMRSVSTRLDTITVTQPLSPRPGSSNYDNGLVLFKQTGVGGGRAIQRSGNVLANSHIYGAFVLVSLVNAAVGVTIRNNYLHDYVWAAIRCGDGVHSTMDCHENLIERNYIYTPPNKKLTGDSGGMYFSTHYFNPGNKVICNYIVGGDRCFYFDFLSSGIEVDGGLCANIGSGVKLNTGKFNVMKNMIFKNLYGTVFLTSCIATYINCLKDPGTYWESKRKALYDSPKINKKYPYLKKICNPLKATSVSGAPCNPPNAPNAASTGYCTGLPHSNEGSFIIVNANRGHYPRSFCEPQYPQVAALNNLQSINVSEAEAKFLGDGNYGVEKDSPLFKMVPNFRTCSKKMVGPLQVKAATLYRLWNKAEPDVFKLVRTASYGFGFAMLDT